MAAVQIFRDAPIVASKVRSIGAMPNRLAVNPDGLNVTINNYLVGGITEDPEPEQQQLTIQARRGDRKYRNNWIRTEWQSVFQNS